MNIFDYFQWKHHQTKTYRFSFVLVAMCADKDGAFACFIVASQCKAAHVLLQIDKDVKNVFSKTALLVFCDSTLHAPSADPLRRVVLWPVGCWDYVGHGVSPIHRPPRVAQEV